MSDSGSSVSGYSSLLRSFWPFIRPQWRLMLVAFFALVTGTALKLLEPWPLKFILDGLLQGDTHAPRPLDSLSATELLTVMAVASVLLPAMRAAAAYAETMALSIAASRIVTAIRGEVYRHLQRLSLGFHSRARGGDLTTRLISDTSRLEDVTVTAAAPLVSDMVMLAGMIGVMFWLNWRLALISVAALPLLAWITGRFTAAIRESATLQRQREGAMAASAAETFGAIKVVQSLSLEDQLESEFARHNTAGLSLDVRGKRLEASLERTVDVLIAAVTAAVLWFGGRYALQGNMTAGELIIFMTYSKSGFRPVKDIAKFTSRLGRATASGDRVLAILETEPEVNELPGARQALGVTGAISFENVTFGYDSDRPILRQVSFSVRPGEHIAIMGASGEGKSTILNLLLRLYDPQEGRITIDGTDIREFTLDSLRSQVAIVLQDSVLFAVTVRENIGYGAPGASEAEIITAARLANAEDFIRGLPAGYNTLLGERGANLSGGQRQRIAIARAAVRRAPIIVLDEPTTGLDRQNETEVMAALAQLSKGVTTLTIAHEVRQIRGAHRVLVMEHGSIVEEGRPHELVLRGGRFAEIVRRQRAVAAEDRHAVAG